MLRLSVLTPSFNYAHYLPDTLASVYQQAADAEHVVVDDGSTDRSREILRRWDDRIVWTAHENRGQSETLNEALELSTGDWIGWLNADDFHLPWTIQSVLDVVDHAPSVDVIYGDTLFVDASGRLLRLGPQHPFEGRVLRWYGNYLYSSSTFVRRSRLTSGWDPNLRLLLDYDLWLRLLQQDANFLYVPMPLSAFRRHPMQVSNNPVIGEERERQLMTERYGVPSEFPGTITHEIGRLEHGLRKLVTGGYSRQLRAHSLAGNDMRWFAAGAGADGVQRIRSIFT